MTSSDLENDRARFVTVARPVNRSSKPGNRFLQPHQIAIEVGDRVFLDLASAIAKRVAVGEVGESRSALDVEIVEHAQPRLERLVVHRRRRVLKKRFVAYAHENTSRFVSMEYNSMEYRL